MKLYHGVVIKSAQTLFYYYIGNGEAYKFLCYPKGYARISVSPTIRARTYLSMKTQLPKLSPTN